jgi:hypothetical protein
MVFLIHDTYQIRMCLLISMELVISIQSTLFEDPLSNLCLTKNFPLTYLHHEESE